MNRQYDEPLVQCVPILVPCFTSQTQKRATKEEKEEREIEGANQMT